MLKKTKMKRSEWRQISVFKFVDRIRQAIPLRGLRNKRKKTQAEEVKKEETLPDDP